MNLYDSFVAWVRQYPTPPEFTVPKRASWKDACALGQALWNRHAPGLGWSREAGVWGPGAVDVGRASGPLNPNPAAAPVGAWHFWSNGKYGHVGRDLRGGGTDVGMFGTQGVALKLAEYAGITSADSYTRRVGGHYMGWSTHYAGRTTPIPTGPSAAPTPPPIPPAAPAHGPVVALSAAWYVFPTAAAAIGARKGHRGPLVPPGTYPVRGTHGGAVQIDAGWLHPKAAAHVRGGTPAPAPVEQKRYVRLDKPWYFYRQLQNALAGNYDRNQMLPAGDYLVVRVHGGNGPRLVDSPFGQVWVGSRTVPPMVWR